MRYGKIVSDMTNFNIKYMFVINATKNDLLVFSISLF